MGKTVDLAAKNAIETMTEERKTKYCGKDRSWSVIVEGFNRSLKPDIQTSHRDAFSAVPFEGKVDCRNSMDRYIIFEDFSNYEVMGKNNRPDDERQPRHVYFGREIDALARKYVSTNNLKKRRYLGPTSMDNELSLVMANMVHAKKGSFILDPFAGTGSILIACAQFGAACMGLDIDIRVRARGHKHTFLTAIRS